MGAIKRHFDKNGEFNLFANGLEDKWVKGPRRWVYEVFMMANYKDIPIDCDLGVKGYACNLRRVISESEKQNFKDIASKLGIEIYFNRTGNKIIIPRQN